MKKKYYYLIIFLLFSIQLFSQRIKHTNKWYFGNNIELDFNTNYPTSKINYNVFFVEGGSSFCDSNGNVLLYVGKSLITGTYALFNQYDSMVKNSDTLLISNSTTSSSIILQHPENKNRLFIFTAPDFYFSSTHGFRYNEYDIEKDSLIVKNKMIFQKATEKQTAVFASNGRDVIITLKEYQSNCYYSYTITKNGFNPCPVINCLGISVQDIGDCQGFMKYSNDGQYLAMVMLFSPPSIQLFKTNYLNQLKLIKTFQLDYKNQPYGLEFSPNNQFLYYTTDTYNRETDSVRTFQYDILKDQNLLVQSRYERFADIRGLQLAPDGKIYIANPIKHNLDYISNPNEKGLLCNYKTEALSLGNSRCEYGTPSFNQSYFYNPSVNFSYETNCIKNSIQFWGKDTFGANSHTWQARKLFGGNGYLLMGNSKNINYSFADTGTYEVRYIASDGTRRDTVVKTIVLYDKIKQDFLGKDTSFAEGETINKTLFAQTPNHCVRWQDSSSLNSYVVNKKGIYICKVTNQAFCEVWDTITINECINNLQQPSLFRSRDTLRTWHINADSFVWYRNNQLYKITKEPYLALTETGTYRVEAAKKGHCNSGSIGQLLVNKLSVLGVRIEDLGIRVFPNPSNGIITIESNQDFKMEIRDVLGRVCLIPNPSPKEKGTFSIELPKGVYFIKFDVGGYQVTEKVVVFNN